MKNIIWKPEHKNTYRLILPILVIMVLYQLWSLVFYGPDPKGINNYVFLLELNSIGIILLYYGTKEQSSTTQIPFSTLIYLVCINILITFLLKVPYFISLPLCLIQVVPLFFLSKGINIRFWFNFYFISWVAISIIPVIGFFILCFSLVAKLFGIGQ